MAFKPTLVLSLSPVRSRVCPAGTATPFNVMVLHVVFSLIAVAASVKVQLARGATYAGFAAAVATNIARKNPKEGMMANNTMCK